VDNSYLGKTYDKHSISYNPEKGYHKLEVVDDYGNRDFSNFYVDLRQQQ
jgi:hypothetical protein